MEDLLFRGLDFLGMLYLLLGMETFETGGHFIPIEGSTARMEPTYCNRRSNPMDADKNEKIKILCRFSLNETRASGMIPQFFNLF
jgi:hypothetical protein